jgi:dipeptidyl aminopeptidase/acylaminoacyl peptidase/DNA-binding transcriptional LysR family regulator
MVHGVLDPQHLRSFQEIARTRSYSAAARRLGYTQPALSYQMRVLERAVGAPLTARAGRVVRLTPAGQALLRHADQILTAIRVAERDLAHVVGTRAGALRVAAFDSAGATLVPAALARVTAAHDAIDARLVQADPTDATAMVVSGDIDVAITYRYESFDDGPGPGPATRSTLAAIPLLTDHVHLVLPGHHPLANAAVTGLWPLADESWLAGSDLFVDLLQRAAARAGFAARIADVPDDAVAMQALVAQGVGVALLPGLALVAYQRPDIVAHRLPSWPARHVGVESWPDLLRVPSVLAMVEALEDAAVEAVASSATGLVAAPPGGWRDRTRVAPPSDEAGGRDRWEAWFSVPRSTLPAAARARPERAVFVSDATGTAQVHARTGDGVARCLTDRPGGIDLAAIAPDGTRVWWFADTDGDEHGVWMTQPFDGGPATVIAPGVPPGFGAGLAIGARRAVVGRSDATGAELFAVELTARGDSDEVRLIYAHPQFAAVGAISSDDSLVAIAHSEHGDAQKPAVRALRVDRAGEVAVVGDLWDGHGFGVWPVAFSPGVSATELLVLHERDGRARPLIWDPVTGREREIDPKLPGETTASWYPDGVSVLLLHQHRARSELYRVDLDSGVVSLLPTRRGFIAEAAALADGTVDYLWSCATEPPRVLNSSRDGDRAPARLAAPAVPASPPLADVTIAGTAGDIHALIARPDGADAAPGPLPTVLLVHGGPASHDADAFSAERNAWTASGYAAVHVNYRGSTGYGAEWRNANIGRPGRAELEDIVAVRDALVANGTADPSRLVIAGRSWGGYLALLALGLYPDLWSLGVALVPVADTAAVYDDMMEEIRAAYRVRFGGSPTDVPDVYAASSPLSVVGDVAVPVLITAGIHDTRCPIRQIELYEARLVEHGKQHEMHTFERGHEARSRADRIDEMAKVLAFVQRHLGAPPAQPAHASQAPYVALARHRRRKNER